MLIFLYPLHRSCCQRSLERVKASDVIVSWVFTLADVLSLLNRIWHGVTSQFLAHQGIMDASSLRGC